MPTRYSPGYIDIPAFGSKEWSDETPEFVLSEVSGRKAPLMGLPCAGCRVYYEATLSSCPVCGCQERVSPQARSAIIHPRSRAA